jgi:glycosyltransferase involved in cell wall biosynthesis
MDELARLAEALAARGVDVTVYGCKPDVTGPDTVEMDAGYRVVYMPGAPEASTGDVSDAGLAPMMGDFARFLSTEWAADPPDVVNAASWLYGVATQLAADRHAIPSVQSLPQLSGVVHRRQGRPVNPAARPRFERLLARSASRVVVSCTEDILELVKLGCPRARLSVLPQAVDVDRFSPLGPADDRTGERRVVAVARELLPHKGLDDLVRTLPRLPAAELVVVGGPSQHRLDWDPGACRLRSLAIDLGVADRVQLTGWVAPEHLPRILRSADAFASPSWYEPFGRPVVEAMACGVPVVASEAGGMLDTIVDDVTGILVPVRDWVKLAKALEELLHGGSLRSGMGLAGRVRARTRYSWERVAAEAHMVYEAAAEDVGLCGGVAGATGANGRAP